MVPLASCFFLRRRLASLPRRRRCRANPAGTLASVVAASQREFFFLFFSFQNTEKKILSVALLCGG